MEDITEADYSHAKRVCKDFKTKRLGKYYDLYVQIIYLRIFKICVLK